VSSRRAGLRKLKRLLDSHHIRYMVIGGLANTVWGRPRYTHDADLKVLLDELSIVQFGELVGRHLALRRADAVALAQRVYVLLVQVTDDLPADLAIGFLPYEVQAVDRAVQVKVEGVELPVCTAEDLIIHKAISERERDWLDIEGVLLRQGDKLDQHYIETWLEEFAAGLDRPQILSRYRQLRAQCGL
jgi:predicted nucleotidyltransferase